MLLPADEMVGTTPVMVEFYESIARGGTVFLDEIGEIPPSFQAKLLRFIENQRVSPRRCHRTENGAGANPGRDEPAARSHGRSRRVSRRPLPSSHVLQIHVPPMRERSKDIPLLAERFLHEANRHQDRQAQLDPSAIAALQAHEWRGNVRELKNAIERMVAMSSPGLLRETEARRALTTGLAERAPEAGADTLDEAEKRHVVEVLRECGGNRTLAAERLGIQRRTLYKKLERWDLVREGHTAVPETHARGGAEET